MGIIGCKNKSHTHKFGAKLRNILHICKNYSNFAVDFDKKPDFMKRIVLFIAFVALSLTVHAHLNDILGDWKTVDDKTGNNYAVVTIYQGADGLYYGKISEMLVGEPGLRCIECKGEDADALLEGLVFIRGLSYDAQNDQLVGGKVLDPESGKFYYGKIYPKDGKLILRGSLDKRGWLGRNQTWIRN